jgi:PhzF family phenazine biosynthesis protein
MMRVDLVDVFVDGALSGNPLAVVHGGEALSDAQMQAFAAWIGFSETTFLLPPPYGADYAVKIFTPTRELPFAGHPTLGSAYAWIAAGGVAAADGVVVQHCGVGLVPVRVSGETLAFRAPPLLREGDLSAADRGLALDLLGLGGDEVLDAAYVCNGPAWWLVRLASAEAVLAVRPSVSAPDGMDLGVIGPRAEGGWEVRAFFTKLGGVFSEDPVTGSFNAGVAQYLYAKGLESGDYVARQGRCVGADGKVLVSRDAEGVWIGGAVSMVSRGGDLVV